ncbi:MAG: SGNH/GDSL hydrolase family protein [Thermoanaerobaculia bacterium]
MDSERRKKILLAGISLLVTLLLAEAALRIRGIGAIRPGSPWFAGGSHPRFLFRSDPASGYSLRPGFRGRQIASSGEFETAVEISQLGIRDHLHTAVPRPPVLALGDSMTFGEGVPADRAWPAVLEREAGLRVYNGGVPGYSTCQMIGRARTLLPRLRPDFVVVVLSPQWDRNRCSNPFVYLDGYIVSEGYLARLHVFGGNVYLGETRLPGIGAATAWAKHVSYLARLVLPRLGDAARALAPRKQEEPFQPGPEAHELTAQALASIRDQAGAGFLAVLIESRDRESEVDRANLEKALKAKGIPYLSLDSVRADWPNLHYPVDKHWNEAGHRTVGAVLAPLVRDRLSRRLSR